jgi:hypothetical protein
MDLPADLKSVEAQLASLFPRVDRLDRDRLIFLAGQASSAGPEWPGRGVVRRWAWPAAFSAMTALAASLAMMLVSRPAPQIVERIVPVPIRAPDQTRQGTVAADQKPSPAPADGREGTSVAAAAGESKVESEGGLAYPVFGWLPRRDWRRLRAELPYLDQLDRALAGGGDAWVPAAGRAGTGKRSSSPNSARQMLDALLNDQVFHEPSPARPDADSHRDRGANS